MTGNVDSLTFASTERMGDTDGKSKYAEINQSIWVACMIDLGFKTVAGSPFQLGHLNATILFSLAVAIPPFCIPELGGLDNDLGKGEARRCLQSLHMNMYASVQSKNKARIVSVQDEIAASQ